MRCSVIQPNIPISFHAPLLTVNHFIFACPLIRDLTIPDLLQCHILCERTAKALARLRGRAGLPEPGLDTYAIVPFSQEIREY